jgi:16S rRNA (uracil1498-N3)-methyltransferase
MSAPMFIVESLPTGDIGTLAGPEGHHAATVQRLRVGESLILADGRGGTANAAITAVGRGSLELRILSREYERPPDPRVTVVQGIAKGERGELAVQAMTEVGVDAIVPWTAARSVAQWRAERGDRSRERWASTAREAAKQARRAWLPEVPPAEATTAVAARLAASALGLVLHEEADAPLSAVELPPAGEITVVVGPEGGVAPEELVAFAAAGAIAVRLGAAVLRTSTAGVAALAVLSHRLGRW